MVQLVRGIPETVIDDPSYGQSLVTRAELQVTRNELLTNEADLQTQIDNLADSGSVGGLNAKVTQASPASTWILTNPLGRDVTVDVYVGGEKVNTDVVMSSTTITVTFPSPQSGFVILT